MKKLLFACIFFGSISAFGQSPKVSVPFELYGDHIFIQLSVDGSEPKDFIFDTGDGLTVLDIDVAKSLNLNLDHKQQTSSAQGTITGALIKHNSIDLGGLQMEKNIKIYATSLKHLEISIGRNVDGIIGYDLMKHHVVQIDYDNMKFNVFGFDSYPKDGKSIPIKMVSGIPTSTFVATLNDGEMLDGTFYINTGAGTTMDFNTPFATENEVIRKTGSHYSYLVMGLGDKESLHYEGRVSSFDFGGNMIENMPIGISQVKTGLQGDDKTAGIVGNRLLKQFNMVIDTKGGQLYMQPNSMYGKSIPVNCSGMDIQLSEEQDKVLIHRVFEGSAAEGAGVKVNDVLVKVNGNSAMDIGLMNLRKMLKTPGKKVELVVSSAGVERTISIDLKELI